MIKDGGVGRAIDEVRARLRVEFEGRVDATRVEQVVEECARRFEQSRIVTYVPVLVEKAARDRLRHRPPGLPAGT